jgi:hypothetical protein
VFSESRERDEPDTLSRGGAETPRWKFAPCESARHYGFDGELRARIEAATINAVLVAAEPAVPAAGPTRAALLASRAFEPKRGNGDLLLEASRVKNEDDRVLMPAVRDRFGRWVIATGSGPMPGTSRLPGRDGRNVILAGVGYMIM